MDDPFKRSVKSLGIKIFVKRTVRGKKNEDLNKTAELRGKRRTNKQKRKFPYKNNREETPENFKDEEK